MTVAGIAADPIADIGRTVMQRVGIPKDRWEIAAQLEVLGYRDVDARERFGCRDLFETADRIFAMFRSGALEFSAKDDDAGTRRNPVLTFLRHYFDGLMFSLPMVVQGVAMLLWGYGLWGAVDIDPKTGSAIGLAFIASYIATSGFAWAIVSRGLYYHYQKEGGLARWSALRMWWMSVRTTLAIAVPALLFNFLYRLLPLDMSLTAAAYYAALVIFWLNWALLYLVDKTRWLVVILAVSIAVIIALGRTLTMPVVASNMIGLAIACSLTFAIAWYSLRRWDIESGGKPVVNPPRLTVLIYATAKVFLYGLLYSTFMFMDRILAWTATRGREDFPPYPFWLSARYELGMDLALIVIVFLAGMIEYSTQRFSRLLIPVEKRMKSAAAGPFVEEFRRFYRRHSLALAIAAGAAIAVTFLVVRALESFPDPRLQQSLTSMTTIVVFWTAAVSYGVLMFALQNLLMLMVLSRADLAVRATAMALAVNVVVGFIVSRAVHYSGSVMGLLAGSIALAILTNRKLRQVMAELDFSYYAAF